LGDAATDEVINAWGEAYWQLANLLIDAEEAVYKATEEKAGGWRGERAFKVVKKVEESQVITSFYLEPLDGKGVPAFEPGQYLGLVMNIDGETTRRNYSLSDAPGTGYLRISVKREDDGLVSNYLHNKVNEGDQLMVIPPAGDFVLKDNDKPLVLVTGGVGITPAISMLNAAANSGRRIEFVHAAINSHTHAFREHVNQLCEAHNNVNARYIYSEPTADCQGAETGYVSKAMLEQALAGNTDVELYFLGPKPFMQVVNQMVADLGVPAGNVHYEFFGPLEDLQVA
jgi:nitric oxide dioxygenase